MPDRCCDGKRTPSFGVQSAYREGKCFSIDKSAIITLDGFYSWRWDFKKKFNLLSQIDGQSKGSSRAAVIRWIILDLWPNTIPTPLILMKMSNPKSTPKVHGLITWPLIFISTFLEPLVLGKMNRSSCLAISFSLGYFIDRCSDDGSSPTHWNRQYLSMIKRNQFFFQ